MVLCQYTLNKKTPASFRGGCLFSRLANQVWQKGHETRALDSEGEFALVPAADAGALARDDLSEGGKVAAQGVGVLVVDFVSVDLAEVAGAHFCELRGWLVHRWVHDRMEQPECVRDEMSNEENQFLKRNIFDANLLVGHGPIDRIVHGGLGQGRTSGASV